MVTVEIARLDGSLRQELAEAGETVIGLKRRLALQNGESTADFRLLLGDAVLRNEQLLAELQTDVNATPMLQLVYASTEAVPENIGHVSIRESAWKLAVPRLADELKQQGIEQGQLLWIDFHSGGHRAAGPAAVCTAYFSADLPSRGDLDLQHHLILVDDLQKGEVTPLRQLKFLSASGCAWELAASSCVISLNGLNLERGQVLGIDAHNHHPDMDAMFCAFYSLDLKGRGPLCVDWMGLNEDNEWSFFHETSCKASEGKDVLSLSGSSNCEGRSVHYTFFQASGDLAEYVEVERPSDQSWDAAADELLQKLHEAGVQKGQVLSIDAHTGDLISPAILLAVFKRNLPGRGPLSLSWQMRRGRDWNELYSWADQITAEKEVVATTGSSDCEGLMLMIFLEDDRPSPIIVNHVTAAGGGWNWAAEELLASLQRHGVQQGQLISLDAHNLSPTDPAMFSAQYSSSLPGYGPLRLQYRSFNLDMPWDMLHRQAAVRATSRNAVAVTGASNERGRRVLYVFYAV
ncbi:unnamed protein product [Durusdinium trenchii]|uniref:Ubiquitin-like domain-containing protein n=1 Tax=Durusdinium trenchii TaxID=1381693 RepID=A0ABP0Q126_9DINO